MSEDQSWRGKIGKLDEAELDDLFAGGWRFIGGGVFFLHSMAATQHRTEAVAPHQLCSGWL